VVKFIIERSIINGTIYIFGSVEANVNSFILKVFEHIIKDSNALTESICGSIGHLNNLKKFDFFFSLKI
jgi:hypothetical protein